ncbi:MAG: hypothetical protein JHC61_00510 [Burkholderiaceae bacterium]|nr:hypothetical protein [Burkholderiaceae bacterium]
MTVEFFKKWVCREWTHAAAGMVPTVAGACAGSLFEGALAHCVERAQDCRIVLVERDREPIWTSAARGGNAIALSLDKMPPNGMLAPVLWKHASASVRQSSECEVVGAATQSGQNGYALAHRVGEGLTERETGVFMSPRSRRRRT